jgi:phosphoribosylaminoimidazolecarboxamide formyltransferase/IMP cyclohydrolase
MKKALISVYYKDGIDIIAKKLVDSGWEIISTGGTSKFLRENNIQVTDVSSITEFPEILDGRVKTLHPLIFGSILAKDSKEHLDQLKEFKIGKIDLVIVNFYPFEDALTDKSKSAEDMVQNIDIGGPSMVRAAAKNFKSTVVVIDKEDYLPVISKLVEQGEIPLEEKRKLAQKAFSYTSFYDSLISDYFFEDKEIKPDFYGISGRKKQDLRYGENPHQKAALYINDIKSPLNNYIQLNGKELSFNNILDLSMVYELVNTFIDAEDHFTVIVKHQNPCGAALKDSCKDSFINAFAGDPRSSFGGIVGFNKKVDLKTAEEMSKIFFEVIIAPEFEADALTLLKEKKNLRIIKMDFNYIEERDIKVVPGGFVSQDRDNQLKVSEEFELKTSIKPDISQLKDIDFGWKLIKFVKSNGIIIVKDNTLIGVGAGQMSRVDSVEIAINKAQSPIENSTLISDAFFPFPDSIEIAAKHKIKVIVEPGGSIKDKSVIKKAEEENISLLFTGMRHFKH